ncbi:Zinc finger BED domain-containing protein RICESLEEPER 2, partial [Bienertia sinuspersici]
MTELELCSNTLEVSMDWDQKAKRAAAADKLNYPGMLLTCPVQFWLSPNYEYFNRVALQPQYRRVPRNTLKRHTQQAYYAYRGYLMEMFRTYDGRVSLTSDTWTFTFGEPFVCMIVHWIDDDWLLQKRIICFEVMEEAHNGLNIKTHKLFFISLDNATANTKAMDFLKKDPSIKLLLGDTSTRWNSTYKLLHDAIAYRDVLTDMYNESRTDGWFITNDHWSLSKIIHDILETFDNATHIFSYVYEPSIHMVILECIKIICTIKQISQANPDPSVKDLLDNMKVEWCAYFNEFSLIYVIATILDLGVKLQGVSFDVSYYVNNCKLILERLCEDYGAVIQPQPIGSSMDGSGPSSSSSSNVGINEHLSHQFETEEDFHIIQWWKNHSLKSSVLARIANDILAIPASTIASESSFGA